MLSGSSAENLHLLLLQAHCLVKRYFAIFGTLVFAFFFRA
ncbi:hypothetical protein OROMI_011149 [Orobanche minor]